MQLSNAALVAALAAVNSVALAQPIYVDDDAPAGGDGSSWDTAFRDLQDALDQVRDRNGWGPTDVYLAQGAYTPDRGTLDREESFVLTSAVSIIGGFAGLGAAEPNANDPKRFVSVLSGDLARDDVPAFGNRDDNAYHVVDASHAGSYAMLRGLTIRGGFANGPVDDEADRGGAIFSSRSRYASVGVLDCILIDNFAAANGAAVSFDEGWITLHDSLIASNRIVGTGLAAAVHAPRLVLVERCRFADNRSESSDAASAIITQGTLDVSDSLFDGNGPSSAVVVGFGSTTLTRCTFAGNGTHEFATAVIAAPYNPAFIVSISGCIFRNPDVAKTGYEIRVTNADAVFIADSAIEGGRSSVYEYNSTVVWDDSNIDADPMFVAPSGADGNPATWEDNDFGLSTSSPCIDAGGGVTDEAADRDVRGNPRYFGARSGCAGWPDMGAIEFQKLLPPLPDVRLYVRADATPGGDGQSWNTAYNSLNDALNYPGVREVWVAAGTYTPAARNTLASFDLRCTVRLLGGFAGDEVFEDERDPRANPTILSGDLLGNDDDTDASRQDNSRRVVHIRHADATIDGLIIEGGQGPDPYNGATGTGLSIYRSTVTLANCIVRDCRITNSWSSAGAISADQSDLTILGSLITGNRNIVSHYGAAAGVRTYFTRLVVADTIFSGNTTSGRQTARGAALECSDGTVSLLNCTFINNTVTAPDDAASVDIGAGAAVIRAVEVDIVNCRFIGNRATTTAPRSSASCGAASIDADRIRIVNTIFADNVVSASFADIGALGFHGNEFTRIIGCTLTGNQLVSETSDDLSAGLAAFSKGAADITISNSILWNNTGAGQGAESQVRAVSALLANNCIDGWNGSLPGVNNFSADPRFVSTDDLRLDSSSPCIDAGDASFLPLDTLDVDRDADRAEVLPLDAAMATRMIAANVDVGAFEFQAGNCPADHDENGTVSSTDYFAFLTDFFAGAPAADFNNDGAVTSTDFFGFLTAFFTGC